MDFCTLCGRPLKEGEGPICRACEERIRAEALGRKEEIARQAAKLAPLTEGKGKGGPSLPEGGRQKKKGPRDFGSLAEYLDYLKGQKG